MDIYNFISLLGMVGFLAIAWGLSENRKALNYKVVGWGIGLQFLIALFVFVVPVGAKFFLFLNDVVVQILGSATAGAKFVFGRLAFSPGEVDALGQGSLGFILAFQAFPTIIFFSSLVAILYYFNIMPVIIRGFARVFTKLMKISGVESVVAASNIFVGIEAALTVKPHLKDMTRSEACTILTVGMATVASSVLGLYVFTLQGVFPTIAAHLVSASLLSAPAALVMSKMLVPESEQPKTLGEDIHPHYEKDNNLFEAVINGANAGVKMIVGITALLIAVLGLVALFDLILGGIGGKINAIAGLTIDWSLKGLLGYIFYPFVLLLGIPLQDAGVASKIIAERVIVTEVVAYQDLAAAMADNVFSHPRSAVVTAYALCGFAHLASMAIFVGGISALAEEKKGVLAQVSLRALLGATLACLLTACIAGVFYTQTSLIFGG